MLASFDIETTGIDMWHGCAPFAYAFAREDGYVDYQEWDVDPYTREVLIKSVISERLGNNLAEHEMVCHNAGFDMLGADIILSHPDYTWEHYWDWNAIQDTMLASHALRNLWPHNLKTLRAVFCSIGSPNVDLIQRATNQARRICRKKAFKKEYGDWRIADASDPHWPAIKRAPRTKDDESGWWVFDMWLPSAIVRIAPEFLPPENEYDAVSKMPFYPGYKKHPWENILREYNIEDAQSTLVLWDVLREALEEEKLYDQYRERMELLRVAYATEQNGVHILPKIVTERERYAKEAISRRESAERLMKQKGIKEPNINSSKQIQAFVYGDMKSVVTKKTKGNNPSTEAGVLERIRDKLSTSHYGHKFITDLLLSKRNAKAGDYLESYSKWSTQNGRITDLFWSKETRTVPTRTSNRKDKPRHRFSTPSTEDYNKLLRRVGGYLHPSIFITGTKFTRQSTSNPNIQNVGTGKEESGELEYQLRNSFGPTPGRVWLAYDYKNIELRIWAYLCGNREFIEAFERNESIHLLIARELHPKLRSMGDEEASNTKEYKRTKNGNFSVIYGATPRTADLTYGVKGAYYSISERFPEVRIFTQQLHKEIQKCGYVETLTGYRLYIPPEDPHKAVSGKIQGTAGSVIGQAMVNTERVLREEYPAGKLIIQVHDELVFDLPEDYPQSLRPKLREAMVKIGNDIDIPLEIDVELITNNWANGVAICHQSQR